MFLTNEETNNMVSEILSQNNCIVTYSEEEEMDIVELYIEGESTPYDSIPFENLLSQISTHMNVNVTSYDAMEIDPFGCGFVFFF